MRKPSTQQKLRNIGWALQKYHEMMQEAPAYSDCREIMQEVLATMEFQARQWANEPMTGKADLSADEIEKFLQQRGTK